MKTRHARPLAIVIFNKLSIAILVYTTIFLPQAPKYTPPHLEACFLNQLEYHNIYNNENNLYIQTYLIHKVWKVLVGVFWITPFQEKERS